MVAAPGDAQDPRGVDYPVQQVAPHDYTALRASFPTASSLQGRVDAVAQCRGRPNGFARKQTAPAAMACSRTASCGNAVINMIGIR
jgi:hypothetical protein